jgi:hypothetical protein
MRRDGTKMKRRGLGNKQEGVISVCLHMRVRVHACMCRTSMSSNCPLNVPESALAPMTMAPAATHCTSRTKEKKGAKCKRRKTEQIKRHEYGRK